MLQKYPHILEGRRDNAMRALPLTSGGCTHTNNNCKGPACSPSTTWCIRWESVEWVRCANHDASLLRRAGLNDRHLPFVRRPARGVNIHIAEVLNLPPAFLQLKVYVRPC